MGKCFHGGDPKTCFFCGVIVAQARGEINVPVKSLTAIETVWATLRSWIYFWVPKDGLTVQQVKKQEAQRVALNDGLITKEELDEERLEDEAEMCTEVIDELASR